MENVRMSTKVHSEIVETSLTAYKPQTIQEMLEAEDSSRWIKAINEELLKKIKHGF